MATLIKADGKRIDLGESYGEHTTRKQIERIAKRGLSPSEIKAVDTSTAKQIETQAKEFSVLPIALQKEVISKGTKKYNAEQLAQYSKAYHEQQSKYMDYQKALGEQKEAAKESAKERIESIIKGSVAYGAIKQTEGIEETKMITDVPLNINIPRNAEKLEEIGKIKIDKENIDKVEKIFNKISFNPINQGTLTKEYTKQYKDYNKAIENINNYYDKENIKQGIIITATSIASAGLIGALTKANKIKLLKPIVKTINNKWSNRVLNTLFYATVGTQGYKAIKSFKYSPTKSIYDIVTLGSITGGYKISPTVYKKLSKINIPNRIALRKLRKISTEKGTPWRDKIAIKSIIKDGQVIKASEQRTLSGFGISKQKELFLRKGIFKNITDKIPSQQTHLNRIFQNLRERQLFKLLRKQKIPEKAALRIIKRERLIAFYNRAKYFQQQAALQHGRYKVKQGKQTKLTDFKRKTKYKIREMNKKGQYYGRFKYESPFKREVTFAIKPKTRFRHEIGERLKEFKPSKKYLEAIKELKVPLVTKGTKELKKGKAEQLPFIKSTSKTKKKAKKKAKAKQSAAIKPKQIQLIEIPVTPKQRTIKIKPLSFRLARKTIKDIKPIKPKAAIPLPKKKKKEKKRRKQKIPSIYKINRIKDPWDWSGTKGYSYGQNIALTRRYGTSYL